MRIYLWHIPFVTTVRDIDNAIVRYLLVVHLYVYSLALLITYIQTQLVNQIILRIKQGNVIRLIKTVFIG